MKLKILFLLSATSLMSFSAFGVTATGNLNLSGSIADAVSITVTPNATASSLNLSSTQTDTVVASVSESSNAANGYTISAKSTNGSSLVHSSDASQTIAYTIKYGASSAVTLTTSDQVVKTQSTGGAYTGVNSSVSISYTGVSAATRKAGTYTDTITFTVTGL